MFDAATRILEPSGSTRKIAALLGADIRDVSHWQSGQRAMPLRIKHQLTRALAPIADTIAAVKTAPNPRPQGEAGAAALRRYRAMKNDPTSANRK